MSLVQQVERDADIPQAPLERVSFASLPYSKEIIMNMQGKTRLTAFSVDQPLSVILKDYMQNMGTVSLYSMSLKVTALDAGAQCHFGVAISGSSHTAKELSGAPEGFFFVANSFNYGTPVLHDVVVPGLYSRQIQPVSSQHPSFRFVMDCTKDVLVTVTFRIIHAGIIREYTTKSF
jgi:hypothetical protein